MTLTSVYWDLLRIRENMEDSNASTRAISDAIIKLLVSDLNKRDAVYMIFDLLNEAINAADAAGLYGSGDGIFENIINIKILVGMDPDD